MSSSIPSFTIPYSELPESLRESNSKRSMVKVECCAPESGEVIAAANIEGLQERIKFHIGRLWIAASASKCTNENLPSEKSLRVALEYADFELGLRV